MEQVKAWLFSNLWAHKAQAKALSKALSISVLNQVVSSGTNFALGLYLVRVLSPTEFGLYGIGFAISLFYSGIGNALLLTQMVVRTPDKQEMQRLPYAGRMLILTVLFGFTFFCLFLLLFLPSQFLWTWLSKYRAYLSAVLVTSMAFLLKEFFVRHAYNVQKEQLALGIHSVLMTCLTILLGGYYLSGQEISIVIVFWIYAISLSLSALYGFFLAHIPLKPINRAKIVGDLREAWGGGCWSVLAHTILSVRTQAHTLIVTSLIGPIGIGKLGAARIFVTPAVMLMPALTQIFLPRIAHARKESTTYGRKLAYWFSFMMLAIAMVYSFVLIFSFDSISSLIVGNRYKTLFPIVLGWCFYTCLSAFRCGQELMLVAFKSFRKQAWINGLGAAVALTMVIILTREFAEFGAIIGVSLSEVFVIFLLCYSSDITKPSETIYLPDGELVEGKEIQ